MANPHQLYEIRCPVHGFVTINDWEREIIAQPAFQRLRRIRQLAWTDQVYPGAMHTRFEHSLGVLHVANRLYESIAERSREILRDELAYDETGLQRVKALVRLTALLHDVGHSPFSHASEELFPTREVARSGQEADDDAERFRHEDYSAAIIRNHLRDAIENHPLNRNYNIRADDIANLLEGNPESERYLLWRDIIAGQLDADRIDYLARDSIHAGVDYGKFDWRRLIQTVELVPNSEEGGYRLGVSEGGFHAAEGLVLARYFMFTQVYFHKTRVAYNIHLRHALSEILPGGTFPRPAGGELNEYTRWDDWKVLGCLADGGGGDHGRRLASRDHFREVYHTPESPGTDDLETLNRVRELLGELCREEAESATSTYKLSTTDILVVSENPAREVKPLSAYSSIIRGLRPIGKRMLYCRKEDVAEAKERIRDFQGSSL